MKSSRLALFASMLAMSGVEYKTTKTGKKYGADLLEKQKKEIDKRAERDAYIAEHLPKDCVWTRCGSASTEEWANTGCGLKEIDINKLNDEAPLNYCQNCGGKITQPTQEEGQ